jgi:hypothetical protein
MHRRDFVKSAAAAATALAARTAGAQTAAYPVDAVIYDERYRDARRFADVLVVQGALALATGRNVAKLWHSPRSWMRLVRASRIAGLTPQSDLFIVRSLVARRNLRILYEGMHDCRGTLTLRHRFSCGDDAQRLTEALQDFGEDWPTALALSLERCALSGAPSRHELLDSGVRRSSDFPGTLVSWVVGFT